MKNNLILYQQRKFWIWVGIFTILTLFWELAFSELLWANSFVFSVKILGRIGLLPFLVGLLSVLPFGAVFHLYSLIVWLLFSILPPFILGMVLLKLREVKIRILSLITTALFVIIVAHGLVFVLSSDLYQPAETISGRSVPEPSFKSEFFSLTRNFRRIRCRVYPPKVDFIWTVPEDGAINVSLHTPVAVRLPNKSGLFSEGAVLQREDGSNAGEYVGQIIGAKAGDNHIMVPSRGSSDISELKALRNADQDTVKNFVTFGQWEPDTQYTAIYSLRVGNCRVKRSFSFTTEEGKSDINEDVRQYLTPLTPNPSIHIRFDKLNLPTLPIKKISIPPQDKIYPTRIEIKK